MKRLLPAILLPAALFLCMTGCQKKTGTVDTGQISDYYPLAVGKYITYDLDSFVYINFGLDRETHHYIARDIVADTFRDATGNLSYTIRRLFRDDTDTTQWTDDLTYYVTPSNTSLELVENNLRYLKLYMPLREGLTWNGNRYLPYEPFPQFYFASSEHTQLNWNYLYENVGSSATVNDMNFDSTLTVGSDATDSTNFPVTDIQTFGTRTAWTETYAKNVGLIYKRVSFEEYQPPTPPGDGYYSGFEIVMKILDHN